MNIDLEKLEKYFGMRLYEAAQKLGVSTSTIKKKCRELGVKSWPRGNANDGKGDPLDDEDEDRTSDRQSLSPEKESDSVGTNSNTSVPVSSNSIIHGHNSCLVSVQQSHKPLQPGNLDDTWSSDNSRKWTQIDTTEQAWWAQQQLSQHQSPQHQMSQPLTTLGHGGALSLLQTPQQTFNDAAHQNFMRDNLYQTRAHDGHAANTGPVLNVHNHALVARAQSSGEGAGNVFPQLAHQAHFASRSHSISSPAASHPPSHSSHQIQAPSNQMPAARSTAQAQEHSSLLPPAGAPSQHHHASSNFAPSPGPDPSYRAPHLEQPSAAVNMSTLQMLRQHQADLDANIQRLQTSLGFPLAMPPAGGPGLPQHAAAGSNFNLNGPGRAPNCQWMGPGPGGAPGPRHAGGHRDGPGHNSGPGPAMMGNPGLAVNGTPGFAEFNWPAGPAQ